MFFFHGVLPPVDLPEYNCSLKSFDEWAATGEKRPLLGAVLLLCCLLAVVFYCVVLYCMLDPRLRKQSCFKLMFYNGIVDLGFIIGGGIITGALFIDGSVYCTRPYILWPLGSFGLGCWCSSCTNCITLAINRTCVMTRRGNFLFDNHRVYYWIGFSIFILFFAAFGTRTATFNSKAGAWLFRPYIHPLDVEVETTKNYFHALINFITAVSLTVIYVTLCTWLYIKRQQLYQLNSAINDVRQYRLLVQCVLICLSTAIIAYSYVHIQFFSVSESHYIFSTFGFMWTSFVPCLVYMTLNRDIRKKLKNMLLGKINHIEATNPRSIPRFSISLHL